MNKNAMISPKSSSNIPLLQLGMILSMMIWGVSWASAKILSSYGSIMEIAALRFIFVSISISIVMLSFRIPFSVSKKGIPFVVAAAFAIIGYSLVFFAGLKLGTSSAGGVIVTTLSPVFAYVIGIFIKHQFPQKKEWVGLFIGALAGAFLIQLWKQLDGLLIAGNLFFFSGAFIWAIISTINSRAAKFGHPVAFTAWMFYITCVTMLPFVDIFRLIEILKTGDTLFWGNMIHFSTINTTGATTFFLWSTTKIGAEKASDFLFLVPAMAALSGWYFLDEHLAWYTIIGGVLGIIAVSILQHKAKILNEKIT